MHKPTTVFERHQRILELLRERTSFSVVELSEILDVSEGTIRNDLQTLDEQGQLRRIRGGAAAPSHYVAQGTALRAQVQNNAEQKQWIAHWASGQIGSGDVIFLDSSTTVLHIAQFLVDRSNLTVVTNGVEVGRILAANPTNTVILVGSILQPDGNSLVGAANEVMLHDLRVQTAFFSCVGFSPVTDLLEDDLQIAQIKKTLLMSSKRRIALIDSSKVGRGGLIPFIGIGDVDHIVTDTGMSAHTIERVRQFGVHVTVCDEQTVTTHSSYEASGGYRIGFANLSEELTFGRDVRRGLEIAAQQTKNIELIVADNQMDPDIALVVADNLMKQQVDLLIEYQIDESVGNLIASKFNAANIPVISVDIPMVGATFFGVDNYSVGFIAGEALGNAVQSNWQGDFDFLIVLEHSRAGSLPAMRITGQVDGFQKVVGSVADERIIKLECGNTTKKTELAVTEMIKEVGIDNRFAVVSFNDDAAFGALHIAQHYHAEQNFLIVGQGCDRRMQIELRNPQTRIIGSTAFRPETYGETLLDLAQRILAGKSVPPAVYIEHVFINASNVDNYYPRDGDR